MAYTILTYRTTFTTPAFLGNAEQSGPWRAQPKDERANLRSKVR